MTNRINKLIETSFALEQKDAKDAGMLGYMGRALAQATIPHTDPKTYYFERTNGLATLSITSRPKVGLPYGSIPRLLLAWICTEAVRTQSPVIYLGRSQTEFLEKLGLQNDGRYVASLRKQAHRLFSSMITWEEEDDTKIGLENVVIARSSLLFWNPRKPDARSLWESTLTLSTDFFEEVTRSPIPIDLRVLQALKKSPLAMDIYTWLVYRIFLLRVKGRPFAVIPWPALMAQFGAGYGANVSPELTDKQRKQVQDQALRSFKKNFKKRLKEVLLFYPEAQAAIEDEGAFLKVRSTKLHIKRTQKDMPKIETE